MSILLKLEVVVYAPIERCFDLSRSIDLHVHTLGKTGERAIAGVTTGLIGDSEEVTWRGKHFGLWLQHSSRITAFERPRYFRDSMVRGLFAFYEHDHHFEERSGTTVIRETCRFAAPLGPIGWIVERVMLRRYMHRLLEMRMEIIKDVAESDSWRRYLPAAKG